MLDLMQETLSIYTLFTLLPTRTVSLDFESATKVVKQKNKIYKIHLSLLIEGINFECFSLRPLKL